MPEESQETQPLLERSGSRSTTSSVKRNRSSPFIRTSSWGTVLKVEMIYKPKPVSALSPRKVGVMACILVTEMCERLSYYSVVANLILFCTSVLKYSSNDAATISLVFSGTTYLTPIIGGYIADAHIGRFNAIYGSALIYFAGLFLLPCAALDFQQFFGDDKYVLNVGWRRVFFLAGLALVAVGTGGIKANVGPFGAHQVEDVGPRAARTFFNWYYWFINAGALLAFIGVAGLQQDLSFAWGFFVPMVSMLVALVVFLLGRQNYRYRTATGSMLADSFSVCWQGCRRTSREGQGQSQSQSQEERGASQQLLDSARKQFGGSFSNEVVDGVVSVVRILPVFFVLIMYSTSYAQMHSTFFIQGERMDLSIGSTKVPVAALNVFNNVVLIILIPVLDRVVYPCFERIGRPLSHLHRIGVGFVLAALSMLAAALVEMERKKHLGFHQTVGNETFFASNISVFLQVPQYALFGCSEAFTSISGLEFAYTQSPASMQGVMTGLFTASVGLGNYLAMAILWIVQLASEENPWFPDEINEGHAEYLFFLLCGLTALFFVGFLLATRLHGPPRPVEEVRFGYGKEQSDSSSDRGTGSRETISEENDSLETRSGENGSQEIRCNENDAQDNRSHGNSSQETRPLGNSSQETRSQETCSQGSQCIPNDRSIVTHL
ncbi:solute carrier family 15 member 4-like [Babylonia areolata]|uniref:solute carrier family 15 member 4-like n=1 Tax=Babylonia areolata TaxID=304850 RepID=UPI003FD6B050